MKPFWVTLNLPRPVFAPEGDLPAGDPAAGDPPAGDPPAGDPPTGDPPPAGNWWEGDKLNDVQRQSLTALGLTVEDPIDAVVKLTDMEIQAKRKLGKPADQLMDRPGEGQDMAEWMRSNGEMFGIPDDADGYTVEKPKDWPKDMPWDTELEAQARKIAHEHGISGKALQAMSDLQAATVLKLAGDADLDLQTATAEMQTQLQSDWGDQYPAKVAAAQQAASVLAEAAGLDPEGIANLSSVLKPKIGDANTIKLFAAVGEMMGEDTVTTLLNKGDNTLATTPAEARAELAKQQSPEGEWYKATKDKNQAEIARLKPRIDQLRKIAAG
ncbi:MAG: hypothetical protein AB3N12_01500 [Ruegeria sp.]